MTTNEINQLISTKEYDFLRTNPHLGNNIILLGLGGSHAYGTNIEGSDIDIRGVAIDTKREILLNNTFDQVIDIATDTTIYSFNKIVNLLANGNPNVLEMLFLPREFYGIITPIGEELLKNRHMFLSKRIFYTFGGYASSQLKELDNKTIKDLSHILALINNANYTFPEKYFSYPKDSIKLYIDKSTKEDCENEIFMDVNLSHYPLRDYKCMWAEMNNIVKGYGKLGKRATHAISHNKVNKHGMHLIRLM